MSPVVGSGALDRRVWEQPHDPYAEIPDLGSLNRLVSRQDVKPLIRNHDDGPGEVEPGKLAPSKLDLGILSLVLRD